MEEKKSENKNKTPERMSRLSWPKAKYGVLIAVIIFLLVNLYYYKDELTIFIK